MIVQPTRQAHKTVFRSWTGQHVKLHVKGNHGPWLSIALFLDAIKEAAPAPAGERSAAGAGAALSGGPDGNHGENKSSTASTAQEVRS